MPAVGTTSDRYCIRRRLGLRTDATIGVIANRSRCRSSAGQGHCNDNWSQSHFARASCSNSDTTKVLTILSLTHPRLGIDFRALCFDFDGLVPIHSDQRPDLHTYGSAVFCRGEVEPAPG